MDGKLTGHDLDYKGIIEKEEDVMNFSDAYAYNNQMFVPPEEYQFLKTVDFDDSASLKNSSLNTEYSSHLVSSGYAGTAAVAAINTSNRNNSLFSFETVPSVRKRHATRLIRKIQYLIEEFNIRVGQQACLLICNPKSPHRTSDINSQNQLIFKVIGASPLDNVLRRLKESIVSELETSLQSYSLFNNKSCPSSDILPPLMVDGIPTPLDKMTQAQLRAFIPIMLKYSTGRAKPSWGRSVSRPPWWPTCVPWANVRSDVRTDEEKKRQSWTSALKDVVRCCYEYHGKDHLLYDFGCSTQRHHELEPNPSNIDLEQSQNIAMFDYAAREQLENRCSGRHILLNEMETVEAQMRALQTSYISANNDNDVNVLATDIRNVRRIIQCDSHLNDRLLSDYATMATNNPMSNEQSSLNHDNPPLLATIDHSNSYQYIGDGNGLNRTINSDTDSCLRSNLYSENVMHKFQNTYESERHRELN